MHFKNKTVADVFKLVVEKPTTIKPDQTIRELFQYFLQDTRTRHVYVIDDENKVIGSVRLNDTLSFILPYVDSLNNESFNKFISTFLNKKVSDVMLTDYLYMRTDTNLSDMMTDMLTNRVNELPVIDADKRILGETNLLEIIKFISNNENILKTQ